MMSLSRVGSNRSLNRVVWWKHVDFCNEPLSEPRGPQNTVVSALMIPIIIACSSGDMCTILTAATPHLTPPLPTPPLLFGQPSFWTPLRSKVIAPGSTREPGYSEEPQKLNFLKPSLRSARQQKPGSGPKRLVRFIPKVSNCSCLQLSPSNTYETRQGLQLPASFSP